MLYPCFICLYFLQLLKKVNSMGHDRHLVCQKPAPKSEQLLMNPRSPQAQDGGSSDEEEEEEEIGVTAAASGAAGSQENKDEAESAKPSQSTTDSEQ